MTDPNVIHDLFGSFRAEWLKDDVYRLFSEPAYFAHLLGNKSCILMGGRGSGKTTVLRCLSYEGQEALGKQNLESPAYVGVYYKINTNVVTAFDGPDLESSDWIKLFGHFLNLSICRELTKYLLWYQEKLDLCDFPNLSFAEIGLALGIEKTADLSSLLEKIEDASIHLELYINNLGRARPTISQIQSPITQFLGQLKKVPGHEETAFYIILDEYENLLDYQQKVVNTLIKHSGDNCYFKIGVRELGWRVRVTLNDNEALISPADYELLHIEERLDQNFEEFARTVCQSRLQDNQILESQHLSLDKLLPSLSTIEEAEKLGVHRRVEKLRENIKKHFPHDTTANSLHDFELFVFYQLNRGNLNDTLTEIRDFSLRQPRVVNRYRNHAHAQLFTIADKGAQVSKHYCGHKTFARIAYRNIRFYMQLVHESIVQQISAEKDLNIPIDCKDQTIAARQVGLNYLRELEGVTARGSHLSKLILGFGRYFQLLASNPIGVSPECNHFHIGGEKDLSKVGERHETEQLLTEAIMHLALVRSPGTKLATKSDTHEWDYSPHPIFAPYFSYSTRKKRKFRISDNDLISMSKSPQQTIKKFLGKNRQYLADADLPKQMSIFDEFFK